MGNFSAPVYVALSSFSFCIAVILYVSHVIDRKTTFSPKGRFDLLLFTLLIFSLIVLSDSILTRLRVRDSILSVSYFLIDISGYFLALQYTLYASEIISRTAAERSSVDKFFKLLYYFFTLLLLLLYPTGRLFTFENREIILGSLFFVSFLYIYLCTVLCVALAVKFKAPRRVINAYLFYLLIMVVGFILEYLFHTGSITSCTGTLSVMLIYINVYSTHYRHKLEAERELAEEQMRMMLWQMQPHFIYNTLSCIQQLCRKSPKDAETAIDEFAEYLRGDIDSLSSTALIPLSRELEFTRHFVNLEKYRFGDRLNIEFSVEDSEYLIPPLTVQPIVENAIHYGICPRIDGGTVRIATFKADGRHVITVSDDGVGFDPARTFDDGRSHVGLSNVRHRIENMCAGKLEIESVPNRGTTVTITLSEV